MRKNKISDILFGLLLLGFLFFGLNGCGKEEPSVASNVQQAYTKTDQGTDEALALQGAEKLSTAQEEVIFSGPEDKDCTSYVIPDGVTKIGDGAFYDCSSLTDIEIPDSVTVIGDEAFCGCSSLNGIEIPDGVTEIGDGAFMDCSSLTEIEIPDGVTEIGAGTFDSCSSLTAVEIPDSVTVIGVSAFWGCSSLTGIEIPDGVTEIGNYVFSDCSSLTDIEIPVGVTEIGDGEFMGCSSLTEVEIPDSVTKIGEGAFIDCSSLTEIEIPDGVTEIGEGAFDGCSSLTSVMMPKNLNIDLSEVFGVGYSDIQFIYGDEAETESKTEPEINTETDVDKNQEIVVMPSLKGVKSVCGLTAPVETSVEACHWDSYGEHPYDVVYDFGEEYQAYVDACDWSLIFDAEYYMNEFPMLALQYHYDEKELLFHFQTIGIHEGRQGSKDFNVYAYAMNSDQSVEDTFGSYYEGYYLYYMLNYDTEKNINTITTEDTANVRSIYDFRPTALQHGEMDAVCTTRNNVGVDDVAMCSELCAFANYRAYLNAHDNYEAHDWAKENIDLFKSYYNQLGGTCAAENTVTWRCDDKLGKITELSYRRSKPHYEAMTRAYYKYIGVSNVCNGDDSSSQFDYFIDNMN